MRLGHLPPLGPRDHVTSVLYGTGGEESSDVRARRQSKTTSISGLPLMRASNLSGS